MEGTIMLLLGQHSQINGMCRSVISAFPSLLYLLYIVTYEGSAWAKVRIEEKAFRHIIDGAI
ncbi:hypothetical protein YC2023_087882 [Brassica napus]